MQRRSRHSGRSRLRGLAAAGLALASLAAGGGAWLMAMPGASVREPLAAPTTREQALAQALETHVRVLAGEIGERNLYRPEALQAAATYVEAQLREAGYAPQRLGFDLSGESSERFAGETVYNLVAELPGSARPDEIVIVGAHYDSIVGSPGADDNASGVAALLALAQGLRSRPQARTVRFVAFVNEEPPFFRTKDMGSNAYAAQCRARGNDIVAMVALDGIGYFDETAGSQSYPLPGPGLIYPSRGTFIGFISRVRDAGLVRRAVGAFRTRATIPSEGAALPGGIPGVGWSDHWAFWQHGYPGVLVTDTLPFRYPHYHSPADTPNQLDYLRLARVTAGLKSVIEALAE